MDDRKFKDRAIAGVKLEDGDELAAGRDA